MQGLVDSGPAADQDGITAATVISDISITVADRSGPVFVFGTIGFVNRDVLGNAVQARILQEGVPVAATTQNITMGAVDNTTGSVSMMAVVENVAIGQTFTLDIFGGGTGLDVKADNAKLVVLGLAAQGAEVANLVSP